MSFLIDDKSVVLVDHSNRTVSTELFEMVQGSSQDENNFDGQAMELSNSAVIAEQNTLSIQNLEATDSLSNRRNIKVDLNYQTWKTARSEDKSMKKSLQSQKTVSVSMSNS